MSMFVNSGWFFIITIFEIIDDLESSYFHLRSIICHIMSVWLSLEYSGEENR